MFPTNPKLGKLASPGLGSRGSLNRRLVARRLGELAELANRDLRRTQLKRFRDLHPVPRCFTLQPARPQHKPVPILQVLRGLP